MKLDVKLLIVLLTFHFSCTPRTTESRQVFTYNETTGIATLDPAFAKNQSIMWAVHQIYNTLVEIDTSLNITPSVARRWTISPDGLTYTFYLRNDVYFHDNQAFENGKGRRVVAADVVYSLKRITDAKTASSGAWIFSKRLDPINGFSAPNDSVFQIRLLRPFHPILGILSMQYCSIVPKEVVEKYGKDFRRNSCGSGPFRLKYWEEGQAMILEKNPHYWEKDAGGKSLPYLDAIKITFFNNKATEFLQFREHKLSFINDIDPSFKDEVLTRKGELRAAWNGKIGLRKHPYLNTEYIGILVDEKNPLVSGSPLKIKKVRQAINYAINKPALMMYLRNSIGIPAQAGFAPGGLPSHNADSVKGYRYDPARARQLLTEADYFTRYANYVIHLTTIPIYSDIGSFIAKQLENVGVRVQVETIQKSLLLEQTSRSEAAFFRGSWIADYPDAENYMAVFYGKNPAPPNYTRYSNPRFDMLYEKSLVENNDSIRYDLYRQMDQLVIEDAPVVPVWYDMALHLVNNEVKNFYPNALNLLELRRTEIRK